MVIAVKLTGRDGLNLSVDAERIVDP